MFFYYYAPFYPSSSSAYEKFFADCLEAAINDAGMVPSEHLFNPEQYDFELKDLTMPLPSPLDVFPRHCFIEVKSGRSFSPKLYPAKGNYRETPLYYVVVKGPVDKQELSKGVWILGEPFWNQLAKRYPFFYYRYFGEDKPLERKETKAISDSSVIFDKQTIDDESQRNYLLFRKRYQQFDISAVFILGNGVSSDFGASSWKKLVENTADYLSPLYTRDVKQLLDYLGDNQMVSAEVAKSNINSAKFASIIYSSLYGKFEDRMFGNETYLSVIGDILYKNPRIEVATYNYDCFLEMYLLKQYGVKCLSPYSGRCKQKVSGKKTVYHLHGVLPYESSRGKPKPKSLVLTQTDYYRVYSSRKWTVAKQKEWFDKRLVLFLGSSLTDVFQLSLLYGHKGRNVFALLAKNGLSDENMNLVCKFYAGLGVKIIFADNFGELREKLKKLTAQF